MRKGGFGPEDARETGVPVLTSPLSARSRRLLPGPSWPLTETPKVGNPMFPSALRARPGPLQGSGLGLERDRGRWPARCTPGVAGGESHHPSCRGSGSRYQAAAPAQHGPHSSRWVPFSPEAPAMSVPHASPDLGRASPSPALSFLTDTLSPSGPPPGSHPPTPTPTPAAPHTAGSVCPRDVSRAFSFSFPHHCAHLCKGQGHTFQMSVPPALSHSPHKVDHDTQCQLTTCVCASAQPPEPLLSTVMSLHLVPCSSPVLGSVCRCRCQQ